MKKTVEFLGAEYVPQLAGGELRLRASVSFTTNPPRLALSVYALAHRKMAGCRGGAIVDMPVLCRREMHPRGMSREEQHQRLQFMADIVAVRLGQDYKFFAPISTLKSNPVKE